MARFFLEHCKGVAGADEDTIERIEVTDKFGMFGMKVFERNGIEWEVEEFNVTEPDPIMVLAVAENPDVPNLPGAYSDYWMLVQEMTGRETFITSVCNARTKKRRGSYACKRETRNGKGYTNAPHSVGGS